MKLTLTASNRQSFVGSRGYVGEPRRVRPVLLGCAALVLMFAMATSGYATVAWQPIETIAAAAEKFVLNRTAGDGKRRAVRSNALDPRHRLPLCDAELEAFMRRGAEIEARTIVGVRCTGTRPWKVFVPVDVIVTAAVVTARRTLSKGHLVTEADLAVVDREVSGMRHGYYTDPRALAGQRLTQPLLAGRVVTPNVLQADQVVKRGQTVTLVAAAGGVNISMAGKALMDGALNQRIRVENLNSGRVVEGLVRSPEHVEVIVAANGGFSENQP